MTLRNQVLVWVGFTLVVILAIWLFRPILLPFVVGIALALFLKDPVLEEFKASQAAGEPETPESSRTELVTAE